MRRSGKTVVGALALSIACCLAIPKDAHATVEGGCASYQFDGRKGELGQISADGDIVRAGLIPVIRQDTPVRAAPAPDAAVRTTLAFNERINVVRRQNGMLLVKRSLRDPDALGWVDGKDLLCAHRPIADRETGIATKFLVKRPGQVPPLAALDRLMAPGVCRFASDLCRALEPGRMYHVHAIDLEGPMPQLLLVDRYSVDSNARLLGWVAQDPAQPDQLGYLYTGRLGVRGHDPRVDPPLSGDTPGPDQPICIYDRPGGTCQAIMDPAYPHWFATSVRLDVLPAPGPDTGYLHVFLDTASQDSLGPDTQKIGPLAGDPAELGTPQGHARALQVARAVERPVVLLADIARHRCADGPLPCPDYGFVPISAGYIRADERIGLDVRMRNFEFTSWARTLERFWDSATLSVNDLRRLVFETLLPSTGMTFDDGVQSEVLARPGVARMRLSAFLERDGGWPVNPHGPLHDLTVGDLLTLPDGASDDAEAMPDCELYLLAGWLDRHREIFQIVQDGQIPLFQDRTATHADCDPARQRPSRLITGRERFAKPSYGFWHRVAWSDGVEEVVWLPAHLLP